MEYENSAAAVVYHKEEYLLLKYEMGHWGFVKGNIEVGESKKETIMRELKEETSIDDAKIIGEFEESYNYYYKFDGNLIQKQVDCFLIKSKKKSVNLSYEHTDYTWLPYQKAIEQLSHENTRKILKKAHAFLQSRLDRFIKS